MIDGKASRSPDAILARSELDTPPAGLSVTSTWLGIEALVIVVGELDVFTAPELERRLREASAASASRVLVDASGLCFIDSAGVVVLRQAARALRSRGGQLVLLDAQEGLRRILGLLGAEDEMAMASTEPHIPR